MAFVMDTFFGFKLPRGMHKEFADMIQKIAERQGEVAPEQIMEEFQKNYLDRKEPYHFKKCKITDFESAGDFTTVAVVTYTDHGVEKQFEGVGNGPIDAVQRGLEEELGINIKVLDYSEHALTSGSGAQAASYIHMMDQDRKRVTYGVGISSNITRASLRGIFSAVNRLYGRQLTDSLHLHTPSYGPEAPPKSSRSLFMPRKERPVTKKTLWSLTSENNDCMMVPWYNVHKTTLYHLLF